MTNFTVDVSQIVLFIGVMAFIVSIITEALKKWTWFDKKVPTALTVIILGTDYMTSRIITLGLGVITFFIKGWFNNLKSSTEEIKKQIKENDDKVNKRIDKLEEETDRDIANIKQELNDIKGDFATTFVLREDFFRSMNGVEDRMRSIDSKIDKLLMQSNRKE